MDPSQFHHFLRLHARKFPARSLPLLQKRIRDAGDDSAVLLTGLSFRDPDTALLLSLFAGGLGLDRFYVGDAGLGVLKLLTCAGCGLWWLADLFLIRAAARQKNLETLLYYL